MGEERQSIRYDKIKEFYSAKWSPNLQSIRSNSSNDNDNNIAMGKNQDDGWRMSGDGWRMTDDGWRVMDDGWRMTGDGWQVTDDGWRRPS